MNYYSCFGIKSMDLRWWLSISEINPLEDQPNPLSDEGSIQYLQIQVEASTHQIHFHSKIDEKLESMCPHYHEMNKLMGDQAFVNPWYKVDSQADNKTATSSTSEPAGNEIRSN
ncbi:hypothetical protein VP01_2192g3 [Puccinia sorghi]|uniref:Uncharacterized protein n=1 Tax=Puccinia sorghi TaxID=27349 RepID=A0A0L6V912_9BASI|nr:hypothetical protein VP01_2192g3 [Puccinia sorghi]